MIKMPPPKNIKKNIYIEAKLMVTKWQAGAWGGIGSWGLTYI